MNDTPMKRKKSLATKILIAALVVFCLGSVAYFLLRPRDIRTALASQLNVPKERRDFFFLNLPPRPNCYPGTVLSTLGPAVATTVADDPSLQRGVQVAFSAVENATAGFSQSLSNSLFGGIIKQSDVQDVTVEVTDLVVVTMDGNELKRRALAQDSSVAEFNAGRQPTIILTAYEGILKFTVNSNAKSSGDAKISAPENVKRLEGRGFKIDANVEGSGTTKTTIVSVKPVVFAYEAASVRYSTAHLGPRPDAVDFTQLKAK
jgi:hypothetical protein